MELVSFLWLFALFVLMDTFHVCLSPTPHAGPSKKLAKNAAAKAALASLCNISYSPMMHPQKNLPLPLDDKSSSMELPQIHADTIGRLVLEKFMEVIKGQESYSRRKVLAGIVMTENMNFNEAQVSGTNQLSLNTVIIIIILVIVYWS